MKRALLSAAVAALIVGCDTAPPTDPADPGDSSGMVQDATTANGGNEAFFWLPPILKQTPMYDGVFNAQLKPKVVICELDPAEACVGAPLDTFSLSLGTLAISTQDEQYHVNWHTDQYTLSPEATYRIQVFLTEREGAELLGLADVQFGSNMSELRNVDTDDYIPLVDGRTLPIKFRIEKGASCDAATDCGEATIGPDGGTVTTEAGFAGVAIPQDAVDGDILIKIRRVELGEGEKCLPTGLRQEEGCYEFDTEPSIGEVNTDETTGEANNFFEELVTVGVCIHPDAANKEKLTLHKFDPERLPDGVVELDSAPESFLTCDNFSFAEPRGLLGRFASAARQLLQPVVGLVGARPLYATDSGRGGVTDAFSFIGWAESAELSLASAPTFALPTAQIGPVIEVRTAHNHETEPAIAADGATLRIEYTDPLGNTTLLSAPVVDPQTGAATPAWQLSGDLGPHVLTVSTQQEFTDSNGDTFLVSDETEPLIIKVGAFATADECDGLTDCGQAVVGPDGGVVTTDSGHAGVSVPVNAVDDDILITVKRVDPSTQLWGSCLPTGLRQEEGCYDFDTEPALSEVNQQDAFNVDVVVGVCIDPDATRPGNLTLHKYDPEKPSNGVVELGGADATFLTCDNFALNAGDGLFGRFASTARRLIEPVAGLVIPQPLYATDTGRGGVTDAFSFIGWAEPVSLTLTTQPDATTVGITDVVVTATTVHNHNDAPQAPSDGTTIRFEYTDPSGVMTPTDVVTTINSITGAAEARIPLSTQPGTHNVRVSTEEEILIDSDLIVAGVAGAPGLFAAPNLGFVGEPTLFLVPDPTTVHETGELTVFGRVSLWTADETDFLADAIGPNDGAARGAVTTAPGLIGNGIHFDGTGGDVLAGTANFADAAQWTVGTWVKLDPAGSALDIQRFVTMGGEGNPKGVLRQEMADETEARKLHFFGGFGDGSEEFHHIWKPQGLVAGCWHHVVGTYNGKYINLYLDGDPAGELAVLGTTVNTDVIRFSSSDEPLTGTLDEIEVHNRALSAGEVEQLYLDGDAPACDLGAVTGEVFDGATGAAIVGEQVTLGGAATFTQLKGRYYLDGVSAGAGSLVMDVDGYEPFSANVTVPAGGTLVRDIQLVPSLATGTVSGIVTDATSGAGISGAEVRYSADQEVPAITNEQGAYQLVDVPAGEQTIGVTAIGYEAEERIVQVPADGSAQADFRLVPAVASAGIDGVMSDGEWDNATMYGGLTVNLPNNETATATVWLKNTASELHVALRFDRDMSAFTLHTVGVRIDHPVNNELDCDDDGFTIQHTVGPEGRVDRPFDLFFLCSETLTQYQNDTQHGGVLNTRTAIGDTETTTFIEIGHPLNSGDVRDMAVEAGNRFLFRVHTVVGESAAESVTTTLIAVGDVDAYLVQ